MYYFLCFCFLPIIFIENYLTNLYDLDLFEDLFIEFMIQLNSANQRLASDSFTDFLVLLNPTSAQNASCPGHCSRNIKANFSIVFNIYKIN